MARLLTLSVLCSLVVCCTTIAGANQQAGTAGSSTVELWDALVINIPKDIDARVIAYPLRVADYVFLSSKDGRTALTIHINADPNVDFFSPRDIASSQQLLLNGMPAWQKPDGPFTQMDVRPPKPKGCLFQDYMLLVFVRGDQEAEAMAMSLRAKQPYPCLSAFP